MINGTAQVHTSAGVSITCVPKIYK